MSFEVWEALLSYREDMLAELYLSIDMPVAPW